MYIKLEFSDDTPENNGEISEAAMLKIFEIVFDAMKEKTAARDEVPADEIPF